MTLSFHPYPLEGRIKMGELPGQSDNTSPPWVVLRARHVAMLTEFCTNRTLPSPMTAFTPPVCRLRAAWMFHPPPLLTHGRYGAGWLFQLCVTMSGQ